MADVKAAETLEDRGRQTLGVPSGLTGVRSPPGAPGGCLWRGALASR